MTTATNWSRFLRLRLLPTAISNLLLGVAVGSSLLPSPLLLATTGAWVALLYLFGMGLNDLRDLSKDRRISPGRPLPSGKISPAHALGVLCAIFTSIILVGLWLPAAAQGIALTALLWVLLYDLVLKEIPILGPIAMGGVRGSIVMLGGTVAGGLPSSVLLPAVAVASYTALVTHFSQKEEEGGRGERALRHAVLTAFVIAAGLLLPGLDHPLAWPLMVVIVAWLLLLCDPDRSSSPRRSTLAMLLLLPLLDLRWMLAYDPGPLLWVSLGLWLTLRPWALPPGAVGSGKLCSAGSGPSETGPSDPESPKPRREKADS